MPGTRRGPRLPDLGDTAAPRNENDYLSLPNSPTFLRRQPAAMSRRPSNPEPPDERSPLLAGPRPSRIRIPSANGSPRLPGGPSLSRNQSYAGMARPGPT